MENKNEEIHYIHLLLAVSSSNYGKVMSALKKCGAIEKSQKEISLSSAARKYGWGRHSLRRWALVERRIPYKQYKDGGTIYFLEADLETFIAGGERKGAKRREREEAQVGRKICF